MSVLLSAILPPFLGYAANLLPSVLGYFEKKQDYAYKYKLAQLNFEIEKAGFKHQELIQSAQSVVDEGKSLRDHDVSISTGSNIDTLRSSVRPVLTYAFFITFVIVKLIVLYLMASTGADPFAIINAIWDVYTQSIFGAVIGFWFGTRSIAYTKEKFFDTVQKLKPTQ